MATVMNPGNELAALFDAYRPTASDADRQAFADDLVEQLRLRADELPDDPDDEHELSLPQLVEELGATPVTDGSFDRLFVNARNRFRDAESGVQRV